MNVFLEKASALAPKLIETDVMPILTDGIGIPLRRGDQVVFDFGDHEVGYLTLKLKSVGSPQDAPAFLKPSYFIRKYFR